MRGVFIDVTVTDGAAVSRIPTIIIRTDVGDLGGEALLKEVENAIRGLDKEKKEPTPSTPPKPKKVPALDSDSLD